MRMWGHYQRGFLLRGGGIGDQPNRYLEAMEVLARETGRRQRHEWEAVRRRSEGGDLKVHGVRRSFRPVTLAEAGRPKALKG